MNDPSEAHRWAFGGINVPLPDFFPDYYSMETHIDCQFKFGKMIKDRFQVICFSGARQRGWDNEMMWAHYGDRQRGVCLEFDEEKLMAGINVQLPNIYFKLQAVDYVKKRKRRPGISWNGNLTREENFTNFLSVLCEDVVFYKSHFWEKEDEKRLLFLNQQGNLFIPFEGALTAVHIGLAVPPVEFQTVYNVAKLKSAETYVMIYQQDKYERWPVSQQELDRWKLKNWQKSD
jgi:hypothetical protein